MYLKEKSLFEYFKKQEDFNDYFLKLRGVNILLLILFKNLKKN